MCIAGFAVEIEVSIHAPHAGRDSDRNLSLSPYPCFNPRAPCGARHAAVRFAVSVMRFNPRAPCGARRRTHAEFGGDLAFQSTRPMRGATVPPGYGPTDVLVSIHAPHAGRDLLMGCKTRQWGCFNPRAPCGARQGLTARKHLSQQVSIHAPHAGRDTDHRADLYRSQRFNPRAPCGARRSARGGRHYRRRVSIHAPHAGRDAALREKIDRATGFNPRAPCGARLRVHV